MQYFGVADWQKFYGVTITPKQIEEIGDFPWSDDVLASPCPFYPGKTIRETHFAFVGLENITIMQLQKLNPKTTEPNFYSYGPGAWFSREKFACNETLKLRWYLMLKNVVPDSQNRTFEEQRLMLLPKEYLVPHTVVEVAKDLFIYKKTGSYVNQYRFARTADSLIGDLRIFVGFCGLKGTVIRYGWDKDRKEDIGLAASRRLECNFR